MDGFPRLGTTVRCGCVGPSFWNITLIGPLFEQPSATPNPRRWLGPVLPPCTPLSRIVPGRLGEHQFTALVVSVATREEVAWERLRAEGYDRDEKEREDRGVSWQRAS
jgi:hypothetical protein